MLVVDKSKTCITENDLKEAWVNSDGKCVRSCSDEEKVVCSVAIARNQRDYTILISKYISKENHK